MIEWVIKIGGSLFPRKAIELANALEGQNCLFVIGGGEFANLIRKYDVEIGFSQDVTHETAIDSMDILAKLLNDKLAFTEISYTIEEANRISDSNKIPIMICSEILKENEPFKHSWDVTSDSIAAYIASLLNAKILIATNVNGIYTKDPSLSGAELISEIDVNELLTFDESSVDLMLPALLIEHGLDCYVVNGEYPERALSIMNNEDCSFEYTFIHNEK
ncbi:delta 1-pyrroline-5-carboxylate synthetase [uncultured Methanobrevibacter sp.]|uniref:amino acid kinase family protein n=1 Tax=uncultured Methanobrevibacter sp. TaxID=253161 RepID=UPI00262B38B8|nr:delta 1-pyrroline-5-carboxylate synthetase [uncultured Methanobrevibacter sp.]